jgi:hypothetical protein
MLSTKSPWFYSVALWLCLTSNAIAGEKTVSPSASSAAQTEQSAPARTPDSGDKSAKASIRAQKKADLKEVKSEAVSSVDGVKLDVDSDKGFDLGDLNPFKWIFKPVTDTQKEVRRLGKQLTEMETPITDLQKPMVGLRQDMVNVHSQMGDIHTGINDVRHETANVDKSLAKVEHNLNRIYEPVVSLKEPIVAMAGPVNNVKGNINTIKSDLKGMKDVIGFTSTAILVAVIGAGLLVVFGLPVAALLVWRNRSKFMRMVGGTQNDVDNMHRDAEKMQERVSRKN